MKLRWSLQGGRRKTLRSYTRTCRKKSHSFSIFYRDLRPIASWICVHSGSRCIGSQIVASSQINWTCFTWFSLGHETLFSLCQSYTPRNHTSLFLGKLLYQHKWFTSQLKHGGTSISLGNVMLYCWNVSDVFKLHVCTVDVAISGLVDVLDTANACPLHLFSCLWIVLFARLIVGSRVCWLLTVTQPSQCCMSIICTGQKRTESRVMHLLFDMRYS